MNWIIELIEDSLAITLGPISIFSGMALGYFFAKKNKLGKISIGIASFFFIPLLMWIFGMVYPYTFTNRNGPNTRFEDFVIFIQYWLAVSTVPFAFLLFSLGDEKRRK